MQWQSSFLSPLWKEINKDNADFSKMEIKLKDSCINAQRLSPSFKGNDEKLTMDFF